MRTLRARLIVSHVVPLLIVLPLVGFLLSYLLETQVFLAQASTELERQGLLVADLASTYPGVWADRASSQAFLDLIGERLAAQIMLLDSTGVLLASNRTSDEAQLGTVLNLPGLDQVVRTGAIVRVDYGEQPGTGAAEVLVPVTIGGQVRGVIRLTDPLSSVYERFPTTRRYILVVMVGGVVVGAVIGWLLSAGIERSLRTATGAIAEMASGQPMAVLPEQGPQEVRLLVRAFNTLTERLSSLEKARSRLLANLVHELGRPLGALLSAIQALASGAVERPEDRQELLDGMQAEVGRLRRILDDLTSLYDRSLGPLELDRRPTDLGEWLAQAFVPWREAAQEKGVAWTVEIHGTLPQVAIDADRLGQALGNLASNAVKFTPRGGAVRIVAGVEDGRVRISVHDSGPGIAPEEGERIFAPFYRGISGQRFPQGMGLGLSIARDLVQAHGGSLEVDSPTGRGTTFTISLPVP